MPAGRPSEYDPAYCERVIALGKQGKSKVVMAAELGVTKPTLENWARQHPEFLSALGLAMTHAQVWWENAGQKGLTAEKFNASIWSRSMAARFPEDWRENSRHEHTGPNGGPIQHEIDLTGLSDEELEQLERIRSKLAQPGSDQGREGSEEG
jgi:transposase